ncbi:hypothetical protein C2845_PM01G21230 [Panicum miliaceum]|uniref:CCR4-NOT transcription complex subunit 1 n=1 Tax=Panicum miliaceum TaxID=4540 RepID=A0A3L6TL15_PANMI|nr:hypothetical protein C2845_PM01G21230 [Panicum miliaceum]
MIPFNPAVAAEVRALIQGADESTFDPIYRELCQLADCSPDGCVLLLQVCVDELLLNVGGAKNPQPRHDLVATIFKYCLDKPYFSTSFCEAVSTIPVNDGFLETLSNELELSTAERVEVGLALSDSENPDLNLEGRNFTIAQIEELCSNHAHSVPNERIQEIVVFLLQTDGLSKHMDSFTNIISLLNPKERPFYVPVSLQGANSNQANSLRHTELCIGSLDDDFDSLLSEIGKQISLPDIITELGYGCASDIAHCKEILSHFEPLDDMAISKLLGAVVCARIGVGETQNTYSIFLSAFGNSQTVDSSQLTAWNIDVLVDSINEIAPGTNWAHVMENLDHEGFNIPDEAAFRLLMSIYSRACKDPFPLHAICGSLWKNTEGQLSFLKHAVVSPNDTFTFAHCTKKMAFPDLGTLNQGNQAWYCLDLLEVLCQLAELGYAKPVRTMLDYPLIHCPEVLLLGVSHINTTYNLIQNEVLSHVFPAMLKNNTHSRLMNYLWHINPYFTLRGFVDAHSDTNCLLRTVEICEDLKILATVLDSTPFAFSIRLATAAFRKDHSNLEKWLTEKLSTQSATFLEECVKFLKEFMISTNYGAAEGSIQHPQATISSICQDSCPVFIKVLRSHSGQLLSNQLVDELRRVEAVYESRNHGDVGRDMPCPDVGEDIEAQANIYFQQMFAGQISVDAMIQMLLRFKESKDKRELSIFNCMISNLFEEYKFFPKYPDAQLKLAAVLFGSVIKHQLVAHLALGIALRGVLDALRKSIDSKMFMFGTTALEQFMDRVIEWPQYCNHILQISHLRGTHTELVSAIEQALAKISLSQNEPNLGPMLPVDQRGSGSQSIENIESSEASWQFINSTPTQLDRTISSFALQQRNQGFLGERSKGSTNTSQAKPMMPIGQPPLASTSSDLGANPKATVSLSSQASPHHSSSASGLSQPSGFLRSRSSAPSGILRQPSYTTGFGAALNIETLVAAAERRDTPIEAKAKEFNEVLHEQYYPWFAQYMVMKRASIEPNFHDLYLKFFDKVNSKSLNKEIMKATYENCKVLLQSDLIKSSSEERSLLKNLGSWLGKFTIGRNQTLRAKEIDPKILIVEAYERGLMIAVIPFTSKILEPCHSSIAYRPPNPWTMGILSLLVEIYNLPNLKMNLKFDIEYAAPIRLPSNSMVEDDKVALIMPEQVTSHSLTQLMAAIPRADIYFRINEKLNSLGPQLQYSKIMDVALDKAIKEIIGPVIQRSVTIASRTTKELILKDYAMESDDGTISRAAHLMVGTLAGSLAHVTSKEPLRVALLSHLRSLVQNLISNSETTEQISQILVNDNLDLGCALTETVATRKAVEMIDGDIKQPFSQLRRQKELQGSAYYDVSPYTQGLTRVPEVLRPKPSGNLSAVQRRVYEDFITVWHSQSSQNAAATTSATTVPVAQPDSSIASVHGPILAPSASSSFSTLQFAPFTSANQSTELIPDKTDSATTQLSSVSAQVSTSDSSGQVSGITNVASVFPPMASGDLLVGELATTTKDIGAAIQASPAVAINRLGSAFPELLNTGDALDRYQLVWQKLETMIANNGKDAEIQSVIAEVPDILLRCVSRDEAALAVAQKVFRSLYENASKSTFVTWLLATLVAVRDVCKLVVKELTSWVIYSDEEKKFNLDIIIGLIRSDLLNLGEYNVHLAKLIDGGRNKTATEFAISLIQTLVTQDFSSVSELFNVVDALSKLATRPGSPDSLQNLIEIARSTFNSNANYAASKDEKVIQSRDKKVLSGRLLMNNEEDNADGIAFASAADFQDKVAVLFSEWCQICDHPAMGDSVYSHYIVQLQQNGLLKGDDVTDRFFFSLTELAVAHSIVPEQTIAPTGLSQQLSPQQQISYFSIDSYSKLVASVVKQSVDLGPNKGSLLHKILAVTARIIQKDAEEKKVSFNPRPYFRLFINWLNELTTSDLHHDGANFQVLTAFANAFHILQPLRVPAWSFCDVIPPSCIQMRNVILSAFPRNMRLPDPSTPNLKIDLLAEISIAPRIMTDVDSALKAKQMKAQRPEGSLFLTDLKQKLLLPQNEANVAGTRYNVPLVNSLVLYVGMQVHWRPSASSDGNGLQCAASPPAFEPQVRHAGAHGVKKGHSLCYLTGNAWSTDGCSVIRGRRRALALAASGTSWIAGAVQQLQQNKANASASAQINQSPQMDIFQIETATELFRNLVMTMDTEGRYLILNAIANQLRYPNSHTHYFSFIILYLFAEATQEIVQEQITRVLLERLIVNRPHPWGLLITFIELIKNPRYSFWTRSFTHCAPEIEKLFESVARSCGGKGADDGIGLADGGH